MKIVGLTGGIGSGKTTVASIFSELGVPVYDSDSRAKVLMSDNLYLKDSIITLLGSESYVGLKLNRPYIASKVFSEKSLLFQLNNLVHPFVRDDFEKWLLHKDSFYVIKEAAIIFESKSFESLDYTILVQAPKHLKIKRVIMRDSISKSSVEARMKTQWSDEKKSPYADFVLYNDEKQSLLTQVLKIHKFILKEIKF